MLRIKYRNIVHLIIILICIGLTIPPAIAEEGGEPEESVSSAASPVTKSSEGKISMQFSDLELSEVVKVLSSLSGANFVTAEDAARKKISVFLENVSFDDALEAIVKGNGLIVQQIGNQKIYVIRLGTADESLASLETRVFKLKYLRVATVKELSVGETTSSTIGSSGSSSSGSSGGGTTTAGGSTSTGGAVSASGGQEGEIKSTVEDLLSPRGKVTINDRTNSLVVTDTPERLKEIEKVIQTLDHPVDQVLIEIIMLETTLTFNKFLGTEWGVGSEGTVGVVSGVKGKFNIPFVNQLGDLVDRGSLLDEEAGLSFGSVDFRKLEATLKALQTDQRVKILAKPKILVLDNEPAFIKITTNTAIALNTQIAAGATTPVQSTTPERTETGVSLKVTPLINDEKMITMVVEPRFSTVSASTFTFGSTTVVDPRVRTAHTTLVVESGQVIVIGGLIQQDQTKIQRKVPLLGDIPLFGIFFTKWTTQKENRELIIFMRPHIVKTSQMIEAKSIPDKMTDIDEEITPFWQIWKKEWLRRSAQTTSGSTTEKEMEEFFQNREKAISDAFTFQSLKGQESAAQKKAEKEKSRQNETGKSGMKPENPPVPAEIKAEAKPAKQQEKVETKKTQPAEKPSAKPEESAVLDNPKPAERSFSSPLRVRPA